MYATGNQRCSCQQVVNAEEYYKYVHLFDDEFSAMADVTSLGIMVGYASDLAFYKVTKKPNITGLNWRMMMALATLRYCGRLCIHGLEVTEMFMSKGHHARAVESMCR